METLMIYALKTAVGLAVFYLVYKWLLSRETLHRFNRIVLLSATLLSFLLPVCVVTVYRELPQMPQIPVMQSATVTAPTASPFPWLTLLALIFVAGAVVMLAHTLLSTLHVLRIVRRGERHAMKGSVLVRVDASVRPFSWGRWVVLPPMSDEEERIILLHECAHIRLHHSVDLLLTDLALCMQWFNPAMWLLRRELRALHEYEADEQVLNSGINAREYQLLLIKKAAGGRWYSVANSFNHSKLKNRITMMLQKPSSRWAGAKVLLFVPLVGLAMGAFAHTAYVVPNDKVTKEKPKVSAPAPKSSSATTQLKTNTLDEKGKKTMEVIAPADIESISVQKDTLNPKRNVMKVTIKNTPATTDQESRKSIVFSGDLSKAKLLYYIDGKEASQEEMKALSPNQIASIAIDKSDASVKERGYDASVHITTRPEEESSASRTVVIKDNSSVSLMTSNGANESTIEVQNDGSSHNMRLTSSGMNEKALVVIDGKRASRKDLLQYNPEQIESITVLKGKQATDLYGKRGENGVIIVTTKR